MGRERVAQLMAVAAALFGAAGCGDRGNDTSLPTLVDVPDTVAIGVLPSPAADTATLPSPPPPPTTTAPSTTAPPLTEPIEAPLADDVAGNRILMIGDSVLASTAPRNGGLMCDALVLFGWEVEIDAEPGRSVDFAHDVLDERLEEGWDAFALSFGNQVDGTDPNAVAAFERELELVLARLEPQPVAVFTVLEGIDGVEGREAVNEVIRALPEAHPNVLVTEFADAGSDGVDLADEDGLVLTEDGMRRLSMRSAAAVGNAPDEADGQCLPSRFTGDQQD
jgi:hypothetical protein